jgi:aspartyl-tRNA(Asn)/glutamyl-tRNA(Gln) amidotransferase subunit A
VVTDLTNLTVRESRDLLGQGKLSSHELTRAYLDRIRTLDTTLHAYLDVFADDALKAAEGADLAIRSGHSVGALHGIPFALKDIVNVRNRVTTGGSKARAGWKADTTAEVARRFFAAGMILLGKTHTVEFAFGAWGTNEHMGMPRNPWDTRVHRTPGGSSSGSAVAVASRMAPWAIGTDTGGSIRIPAAFCGLTGLKPTVGTVSTEGVLPLSMILDSIGPLARTVEDAAILFETMRNVRLRDAGGDMPLKRGINGLVIGAIDDRCRAVVSRDVLDAYDRALAELSSLGAEVVVLRSLPDLTEFTDVAAAMMAMETYSFNRSLFDDDASPLDSQVRARVRAGIKLFGSEFQRVLRKREELIGVMDRALATVDAFVTPTVPVTAIPEQDVATTTANPGTFTRPVNISGRCALAVPSGADANGLPTSLQIVCGAFQEQLCLRIGQAYQEATQWHLRQPQLT